MAQFYTLLTDIGQAKIANAIALKQPIEITHLAVGDGNGSLPTPNSSNQALVNEVRRAPINTSSTDPDNPSWIIVEQILPPDIGGWTVREIGIFDQAGDLIGIGNYPETYKPVLSEGSSRTQTVRFVLEVSDTAAVTLKIDPSVVLATREYVDAQRQAHEEQEDAHYQYEKKEALGTAAYKAATEDVNDKTNGRLLQVGDTRVGMDSGTLGTSYKGVRIPETPGGSSWFLPLGLANDPAFRIHGTFYGGRSTGFNTGERWARLEIDHANRNSGGEPNTQWILRQQGFGSRLIVESRLWQGQRWIGITQPETDQNVWQTLLVFDGYLSQIPDSWINISETSTPEPTYTYGPNTWEFQGHTVRHAANTTVDSNGFIKVASPIIRLFADHIEENQAIGGELVKVATGQYEIHNTPGFADNGWYIETPRDANGNIKVFVEYQQGEDGTLFINTYEPDYANGRTVAGEPADIPDGRWIDLRLKALVGGEAGNEQ